MKSGNYCDHEDGQDCACDEDFVIEPWVHRGHEFNTDAVCVKCGFDGAEWSWLNTTAYREDRRPMPTCNKSQLSEGDCHEH